MQGAQDRIDQQETTVFIGEGSGHLMPTARSYIYRGRALSNLDQNEEAIADFDKAIALEPDNPDAYFYRGVSNGQLDNWLEVLLDLTMTLTLDPTYTDAYGFRGVVYAEIGNTAQAIRDMETFLEKAPDSPMRDDVESLLATLRGNNAGAGAQTH